jgi:anti-sigma B factor antagonist
MDSRTTFSIMDAAADKDTTVVSVKGDVGMDTSAAFQRGLLRAMTSGRRGLVVDKTHVSYIDSTALTSLASVCDALRAGGGTVAIVCDETMRELLEIARLDHEMGIFESVSEALRLGPARVAGHRAA